MRQKKQSPNQNSFFDGAEKASPTTTNKHADAIQRYLETWTHTGCGGHPVIYVGVNIGCSKCKLIWDGQGYLGNALKRSKAFSQK